jgi:hypothetical protein
VMISFYEIMGDILLEGSWNMRNEKILSKYWWVCE